MRSEYLIGAIALLASCTGSHSYDGTYRAAKVQHAQEALDLRGAAQTGGHNGAQPKERTLVCRDRELRSKLTIPIQVPPKQLRWLGERDDDRRHANVKAYPVNYCSAHATARVPNDLGSTELYRFATMRMFARRCLLTNMDGASGLNGTYDRPFIPRLDGKGTCASDEAWVIEVRKSAEDLLARAFEARASEPDICTTKPTLPTILGDQAFLAFARGDLDKAAVLYARTDSVCPNRGLAPLAALRRADISFEAALTGERTWNDVDEAYLRTEELCANLTCSNVFRAYLHGKRAFVLLKTKRTDEANELFRNVMAKGGPPPEWLRRGWWCKLLDEDVRRWGTAGDASCVHRG